MKIVLLLISFVFLLAQSPKEDANLAYDNYKKAAELVKKGDIREAIEAYQGFLKYRPNHSSIMLEISKLHLSLNDIDAALLYLSKVLKTGQAVDFKRIEEFEKFSKKTQQELISHNKNNSKAIENAVLEFETPILGLVTEGVIFDEIDQSFYVTSVYDRAIYRYKDAVFSKFSKTAELYSTQSLRNSENHIWLSTSAIIQMKHHENKIGPAGIVSLSKKTGEISNKFILDDGEEHIFGDFVFADNNRIYVSDSKQNRVYLLDLKTGEYQGITPKDYFYSLQGLVYKDNKLCVADYGFGLFQIDLNTNKINKISAAKNLELRGIDGLYEYKDTFIASQNGSNPHRIIQIHFSKDNQQINRLDVLAQNMKEIDDPTLGHIVGNRFYFIGNSQWSGFNRDGSRKELKEFDPNYILRLDLD